MSSFLLAPTSITTREKYLLAACAALVCAALLISPFDGGAWHSHHFADGREWLGIPCAGDVLSNLPFAVLGVWGMLRLIRQDAAPQVGAWRACAWVFFSGLLLTALGSSIYHWRPDDAGLMLDRGAMAVAFAGMLGLAACDRVSARAGLSLAVFALLAGGLSIAAWRLQDNLLPWGVVQFGGMAVVLVLACLRRVPDGLSSGVAAQVPGLRLGMVVLAYALAKVFELADEALWVATGELISGHTLKHLAASLAALPVLALLTPPAPGGLVRHNARGVNGRKIVA